MYWQIQSAWQQVVAVQYKTGNPELVQTERYCEMRPVLVAAILIAITLVMVVGMIVTSALVGSHYLEIAIGYSVGAMLAVGVVAWGLK